MSNGKEMINELNYSELIENMPSKKRSIFTAMQVYELSITLKSHITDKELHLTHPTKKRRLASGSTIVTAVVAGFYTLGRQLGWWA